jgi:SAM-dependent methyltransferase
MTSSRDDPVPGTLKSYEIGAEEYAEHSRDRTALNHLHARFAALAGKDALVLDLGCGPAHDAAELAGMGLRALGCDATRGLLAEARSHPVLVGHLVQVDVRRLPFATASLDGIWACASLLHIRKDDVPVALREAYRVLRKDGTLFTSVQHGSGEMVPYEPGFGLPTRIYFFYLANEWEATVRRAGFEVIDQHVNPTQYGLTDGATGWIETFGRKP